MRKTVIAVTGGIGSGKSAVVSAFTALGIPAYDCDSRTKELYRSNRALAADVARLLGPDVLAADGSLSTRAMAAKLFSDKALMHSLEEVVHPAVGADFRRWAAARQSELVVMESAILLEKPFFDNFADCIITVSAPQEVRIQRVMRRNGLSREQVLQRMSSQWSDSQREARADMVLVTDDRHAVLPQILELIDRLKQKSF